MAKECKDEGHSIIDYLDDYVMPDHLRDNVKRPVCKLCGQKYNYGGLSQSWYHPFGSQGEHLGGVYDKQLRNLPEYFTSAEEND